MLKFLKPFSFIPALVMMYLIFSFSSQDGITSSQLSYKVSYKIVETGGNILGEELEPWEIDSIATRFHGIVRKIAHMTEYFLLAVAVAFPLYVYGLRGILLMIVAGLFCVAFACGDEYHQSFIEGRSPSRRDVLIDSFGVFWGIILVRIVGWTGRKTIFRPWGRKKKTPEAACQRTAGTNPPYPYGNPPAGNEQFYGAQPYGNAPYGEQPYIRTHPGYQPHPAYGSPQYITPPIYQGQGNPDDTTSDRLSEDMSLKKLVRDLKDQKKEHKRKTKKTKEVRIPDEPDALEIDEIDLDGRMDL